mmetsp:Transcript_6102/g.11381  ORF Transcript_6102/g.11381 Transcript_6102/m.11381 type:complete len:90 (+) Transcript_6102:299-568(+)
MRQEARELQRCVTNRDQEFRALALARSNDELGRRKLGHNNMHAHACCTGCETMHSGTTTGTLTPPSQLNTNLKVTHQRGAPTCRCSSCA